MKKKIFTFVLSIFIVFASLGMNQVEAATYNGKTSVNLNVRTKPALSGKVYTTLKKNSTVNYSNYNSSWVKIYLKGKTYYASKRYVVPTKTIQKKATSTVKTTKGVTTTNLNIRTSPSLSGKVYKTLKKNTKVDYASHNSSWVKVVISGKTYYASKKYVKSVSTTPSSSVTSTPKVLKGILTTNLNIRMSPSLNGKVYKTLKKNTKVDYVSHNSSWVKVIINKKTYYASKNYVKPVTATTPSTPSAPKVSKGILTSNLNIRTSPSLSGKVYKTLKKNTKVDYAPHNSSWVKVIISKKTYYASKTYIKPVTTEAKVTKVTGYAKEPLKLYSKVDQNSTVIKTLPGKEAFTYSKHNSDWSIVYIGTKTYYTLTKWITAGKVPAEKPLEEKYQGYAIQTLALYDSGSESASITKELQRHETLTYSKVDEKWVKVYIGSIVYYAEAKKVALGKPGIDSLGVVYVNVPGDVLNVRESASVSSKQLGALKHATEVEYYATENGFHKIKFNGQFAYISSGFVKTTKPADLSSAVIILDPGHGGKDPGAVNGSLYEKTIVLDVTKRTEAYLRSKYNYTVRLTRSTDVYLTLEQRVAAAKSLRGNLFVSMHVNAAGSSAARGIETYYSTRSAHSARSRVLATNIQSNLASKMSGMSNRGVKTANYHVITYNTMPSALVELGFISSPTDLTYLRSDASRQRMAEGVAEGIAKYVQTYH
ncbi:N-acetylmuramoyl-L-alanine amidase [Exiguobacterium aestuarii]|uniref:N-acetylmuramoyl-L-alanine amidase n=1 Tax=Exiguobacterium aestuarii TaxID=273527 RepID=A0ABW2PIY5_9BACL|nr:MULTISPECIES: N-acetylmuramoyl-L-alanine amidase [Exiguobacterium]MCT4785844.1 N-acetylmuramoyl-L-alanine amidase [Exiguobacterium aestuarii]